MQVKMLKNLEKIDDFVIDNTPSNSYRFFKLLKWINLISNYFNYIYYPVIVEENNKVIAYFPFVLIKSKMFGNHMLSSPFTCHGGGIVFSKNVDKKKIIQKVLNQITKIAKKNKACFLQIRGPEEELIDYYIDVGFKETLLDYNFLLDLNVKIEQIRKNLNKKLRNCLKNAEKKGIEIEINNNVDEFYNLYLITMQRLGSPPNSKRFFMKLLKTNNFIIYTAKYKGKIIAGCSFVFNDNYATWQDSVSLDEYKHLNANTLLVWEFIKSGINTGIKTFDLGCSRDKSTHYNYKKKWGAKIVKASKLYYYFGDKEEVIDVRSTKYSVFSTIWRLFMPKFATKLIRPSIRRSLGY